MLTGTIRAGLAALMAVALIGPGLGAAEAKPGFVSSIGPLEPAAPEEAAGLDGADIEFIEGGLLSAGDPPPPPAGPPEPYTRRPLGQMGVYVGGVFHALVIPEDDMDFLENGVGWGFTIGYAPLDFTEFMGALGLEFTFEFSEHDDDEANDTAKYTRLLFGFKAADTSHDDVQPYFTAGVSFHDIDYDNMDYNIDGFGGYFGAGMDFYVHPTFSIGVDIKIHAWSGEDNLDPPGLGDGFAPAVGITFLGHF